MINKNSPICLKVKKVFSVTIIASANVFKLFIK